MKNFTVRNLIYSSLAIALASSYLYVQSQPASLEHAPRVASDEQQAQTRTEIHKKSLVESRSAENEPESDPLAD